MKKRNKLHVEKKFKIQIFMTVKNQWHRSNKTTAHNKKDINQDGTRLEIRKSWKSFRVNVEMI